MQKEKRKPTPQELEKARKEMNYWLARIYTRALADLIRGRKDV